LKRQTLKEVPYGKKTNPGPRIDEALLEMAQDFRGSILTEAAADKITMRVLAGKTSAAIPKALSPQEIRALREQANMSQGVFARILNVTTGYVSQLERGAKRPSGPALALLGVIKRKGIQAIL
jgi:putative transcriptional regulator